MSLFLDTFIAISRFIFPVLIFFVLILAITDIKNEDKTIDHVIWQQICILIYTLLGLLVLYFEGRYSIYNSTDIPQLKAIILYFVPYLFILFIIVDMKILKFNRTLMNLCILLLTTGIIILTRLDQELAFQQVKWIIISSAALLLCLLFLRIPIKIFKLKILYGIVGLSLLLLPFFYGQRLLGAMNWVVIGDFSFQPSEFVKIILIFMLASLYRDKVTFKKFITGSIVSAVFVLILVIQKDLGAALIYMIIYLLMTYIYLDRDIFLIGGLMSASLCAYLSYLIFDHVQVRVEAWMNPWEHIETSGYQIAQSLFAISEGGWFGTGLTLGMPEYIPIVTTDFIFSAVCEEMGLLVGIGLICTYMVLFYSITHVPAKQRFDYFLSYGVAVAIMFQVFLIVGGVIKLIPLTGVTLPFVSYGGSSMLASMIMIAIIESIYLKGEAYERKKKE